MSIQLRKKGSENYLAFHSGDFFWYIGTKRQGYCFADVKDARQQYKHDLSGWEAVDLATDEVVEVLT
jgi:hypothetical protein